MYKPIKAHDSVVIDKHLQQIKNVIDKYDNYFFTENPVETLEKMKKEIDDIFDWILVTE